MAVGYSRSPKLLKGALIRFASALNDAIPSIIVFQYNPDSLSRSMTPFAPPSEEEADDAAVSEDAESARHSAPTTQPYDPMETFTLSLFLDATDGLEEPENNPVTAATGVADRLAALEMLLYPIEGDATAALAGGEAESLGGEAEDAPEVGAAADVAPVPKVPIVLFVWGPGRIVPVRVTSFGVEEQQFNQLLYPHRARVNIGMRVMTDSEIATEEPKKAEHELAIAAYKFTRGQKQALSVANIANSVDSILGLLPF